MSFEMMRTHPDVFAAESATPCHYICHRSDEPVAVDGRAGEPIWKAALWTSDFIDIEGGDTPPPRRQTRVKMLHDPSYLYIHAELEEPHVRATITRRNAVIFQDNDFEVFIDPDGDNHDYYELEINALNTVWELSLPRPYRCGAKPRDPDPIEGLRTAVHVDGSINDPSDVDRGWSVTLAIPFTGLARFCGGQACPPVDGDQWRMNFSRVQWPHEVVEGAFRKPPECREDNWVWSPQGVIDMHRPATWGYVQFSDIIAGQGRSEFRPDPTMSARNRLMGVWERQRLLDEPTDDPAVLGFDQGSMPMTIERRGSSWTASMKVQTDEGYVLMRIDESARLTKTAGGADTS